VVRAILSHCRSSIVVDDELLSELKALAVTTAERPAAFHDERRKGLQPFLRRTGEDLARIQIELTQLGFDCNRHGDLVRQIRAALDEIAFELGGGTGRRMRSTASASPRS
jgi:hypothetical protein